MRYSLRNEKKVQQHLGREDFMKMMCSVRNFFFLNPKEIFPINSDNEKYKMLVIDSYEFYIIGTKFDVINLAFKRAIK